MEQPGFGRRLKQLRTERGLTQADLVGDGMSTGYLSRLESGARPPTPQAVRYLAERLGVALEDFSSEAPRSLSQVLATTAGVPAEECGEILAAALRTTGAGEDPALRWQALWLVATWRRLTDPKRERADVVQLVALADEVGLPEMRVRSRARLSRVLRQEGDVTEAVEAAFEARRLAADGDVPVRVLIEVVLTLVAALTEAGRLSEARRFADELVSMAEGRSDVLGAQAMWTAATVRGRQGEYEASLELFERIIEGFDGRHDPGVWMQLRMNAATTCLMVSPSRIEDAARLVEDVEAALPFAADPSVETDLLALRARLAVDRGRVEEAREVLERLKEREGDMEYQVSSRVEVTRCRLMILEGRREEGVAGLRVLAEKAQEQGSLDLAASIWRTMAEALAGAQG